MRTVIHRGLPVLRASDAEVAVVSSGLRAYRSEEIDHYLMMGLRRINKAFGGPKT
jgi:hypothetical protein